LSAGDLKHRLKFESRRTADDGAGNREGDWVTRFACRAKIQPKGGGEEVTAARLSGHTAGYHHGSAERQHAAGDNRLARRRSHGRHALQHSHLGGFFSSGALIST
jgi:hypothetical protein